MSITVVSSTDSQEVVKPAHGEATSKESQSETQTASDLASDENLDASDASEGSEETQDEETQEASGDEDSEENLDSDKGKKKNGFKKRIDKLRKRTSVAEQERDYWRQEALKKGSSQKEESIQEQAPKREGRPSSDQFETHEDYVEALADWKFEQKLAERDVKAKESEAKTAHQKSMDQFQTKIQTFTKEHEDFKEVVESVDDVPMSIAMQELILQSDNGPELMYELAKNRKEFERMCSLSPLAAAREFGKFESRMNKDASSEKVDAKLTTKAPKPLATVGKSTGSMKKSIYDESLSQAEYERLRSEQLRAR